MQQSSAPPKAYRHFLLLFLLGVSSTIIYIVALLRFPLAELYTRLRFNLADFTHSDIRTGLVITACTIALFISYTLGALVVKGLPRRYSFVPALILIIPLIFVAILLFTQPATSLDLYDYLFRGRMLARYHANTFVQVPRDFESDPLFKQVAWRGAVTAYGPLWEGMSWLTAWLAGEAPGAIPVSNNAALLQLMFAYKINATLGFLLCGAAIWGALGRIAPKQRWLGLYLWLWNPLAIWESVAAGHNDAWMTALIVLAVWALTPRRGEPLVRRRRNTITRQPLASWPDAFSAVSAFSAQLAFLALTIGGLIKYVAFFFGPTALMAALRQLPSWRKRLQLILISGVVCSALVVVAYAQFWVGMDTLTNVSARENLFTASWLATLQPLLIGIVSEAQSKLLATRIGLILLLPGVLWSAWRGWRAPRDVSGHMLWLLLWFLFVCNPWFQPWYLLWALGLVALQPWRARLVWTVILFCLTSMLSYSAVAFLRPALGWNANSAAWNAVLSVLIYLPPLIALGWSYALDGMAILGKVARLPRMLVSRRGRDVVVR